MNIAHFTKRGHVLKAFGTIIAMGVLTAFLVACELPVETVTPRGTAGLTISETSLSVDENGGTATYTVRLNILPTAPVTVTPTIDDSEVATISDPLTFNTANWSTPQTVTVTGVDNELADMPVRATVITHAVTSRDTAYSGLIGLPILAVRANDDDTPGITLSPDELMLDEGEQGSYTIQLSSQPSNNVVITITSDDRDEATVDITTLTFTPSGETAWNRPKTVTVTAVDDDATVNASVVITHAINTEDTADATYAALRDLDDVEVTVTDDDTPRVRISPTMLTVTETSGENHTATYMVRLNTQPGAEVTITPTIDDSEIATVDPNTERADLQTTLTFTPQNWAAEQPVTVTGVDNAVDDGTSRSATISHTVTGDATYAALEDIDDVAVIVDDDDTAGVTITETGTPAGTALSEGATGSQTGARDSYSLVLTSEPSGSVVITVDNTDTGAVTVDTSAVADIQTTLTFTRDNWSTPQSVTVTPVDDSDARNESVTIGHDITTGAGTDYPDSLSIDDVTVTVDDDDTARVTITQTGTPAGTALSEGATGGQTGASDSYSLVLTSRPSGNVVITVDNPDTGAVTVDTSAVADIQATLTFTRDNWSTPQSVTVTPVDDSDARNESVTIGHDITTGAGTDYPDSLSIDDVTVTVDDDETAGVTITETGTPAGTALSEGATGGQTGASDSYSLVLTSRPSGNVVITVDNPDTGAVTVDTSAVADIQATLTFTRDNWSTPQSVTVTPVDDSDARNESVTIGHDITTGAGTDYPDSLSIDDVTVTVDDDETAGVTITETGTPAGTALSEGATGGQTGASDSYSLVLISRPSGNVVITVDNTDIGAVTADTSTADRRYSDDPDLYTGQLEQPAERYCNSRQ